MICQMRRLSNCHRHRHSPSSSSIASSITSSSLPSSLSSRPFIARFDMYAITLLLLSVCFHPLVLAFNLEPKLPIVKFGPANSYFGYAVAEHTTLDEKSRVDDSLMLVGAPVARSLYSSERTGAVYKCKLTTQYDDCVPLRIDHEERARNSSSLMSAASSASSSNRIRDNQWLGVTLKSQGAGGYVMACAHRYIINGSDYQWGQGICHSLTQHLQQDKVWEPCYNRPIGKAHEEYGYCQAGTSGHVSQDNEIIIGTPGPYTWRGTVYTNSISFHIRDDKQWYAVPVEHHSPVDKYSYLGMSVTSARIIGNRMTYVSGAPRANGTGQVLLFTKHPKRLSAELQLQQRLHGEQFASSFGYSLTTLDANGDQLPDLVVGAPFYYSPKATHIGGAVYVYYNVRGKLNDKWDTLLLGNSESRFGFALANLNDLNKDGYEDLAVGAPYDSDGGAVYVYLGSATGLSQTPVQVIRASDLPSELPNRSPFKTFGYSLSGGIDLDENGYPDLLVGAYESDAVVLLRSRPIIDIETYVEGELDNIDPEATSCRYDPSSKLSCFRIDVCFRLKSSVRTKSELRILYRIEAETFEDQSKYYRIKFNSSIHSDSPNIVEKLMQIVASEADKKKCNSELIFLKVNKDKSDLQNPIRFQLTFKLRQPPIKMSKPNERLPDINRYPILNQIEAQKVFEAKFHKDCGDNDVCESDMRLATAVSLPKTPQQKYVLELEDRQFNVSVLLANLNEPAYDAKLYIEHGNVLNYVKMYSVRGETVDCLPKREFVECSLGNPYNKGESQFTISFSPSAHLDDESKIMLRVTANTTSQDVSADKNVQHFEIEVVRRAELEVVGRASPGQALFGGDINFDRIKKMEDIGSEVQHTYIVTNYGPWRARSVYVDINWPFEVITNRHSKDSGRGLLYLVSANVTGGFCQFPDHFPPNYLNLRNDSFSYLPPSRVKREAIVASKEIMEDGKTLNIVQMDCKLKTARCFTITCQIPVLNIESRAVINIVGRLWSSTLVENYAHGINQIHILSRARVYLDRQSNIRQHQNDNDEGYAKTKAYPDLPSLPAQRPSIWIIILAVIFGILILTGLIVALWKCGFFNRKKPGYLPANQDDDFSN